MCGIVGYVGFRDASSFLTQGLRRLEYRGYDSSGVATITPEGEISLNRAPEGDDDIVMVSAGATAATAGFGASTADVDAA